MNPQTAHLAPNSTDAASAAATTSPQAGEWDILLQRQDGPTQEQGVFSESTQTLREGVGDTFETVTGARDLHWPDRHELLGLCREADSILAAVLLLFGIIYAAFGYSLYRTAATLNVAGLGVWLGWLVGKQMDAVLPSMVIGGVLFAALAWPAMRVAVAICSGIIGFAIGVAVWRALGMADNYAAAGGLIGGVFLFMLSFSLFKLSVLAFTAAQGVAMFLAGLLGLLLKYPNIDEAVTRWNEAQPALMPIALLALTLVALLYQQHWHRPQGDEDDDNNKKK